MNDTIVVEKLNEVFLRLRCDISQTLEIRQYFTCLAPNFQFHPKFKSRLWDGKLCFFDYRNHTLPIGLLPKLARFAKQFNYELKLDFDVNKMSNNFTKEELDGFLEKVFSGTEIVPRDYQVDAIYKGLTNKRGIILSPTGCHVKGTEVILYNGQTKKVEDIEVGDVLLGPDGEERNVLKLYNGHEKLYKIIPKNETN